MRICPWRFLSAHADTLREDCMATLEVVTGAPMDANAASQAVLPGHLGGLSLALPSRARAAAAFLAAERMHRNEVAMLATKLARPLTGVAADTLEADEAQRFLLSIGVDITGSTPSFTEEATVKYDAGPCCRDLGAEAVSAFAHPSAPTQFLPDSPAVRVDDPIGGAPKQLRSRLYGRKMRLVQALEATDLHANMLCDRQVSLLTAGGEGTGSVWSTVPARKALHICNAQWGMATKMRLGIATTATRGQACSLRTAAGDEACGTPLDDTLHHPALCKSGKQACMLAHNALAAVLMKHLQRSGAFVDQERPIPELYVEERSVSWMYSRHGLGQQSAS